MHQHSTDDRQHIHAFLGERHERNERKTWIVIGVTAVMMIAEIAGGTIFGSMALIADGWHMSTHAGALAISAFAYMYARRHKDNPDFAFGTGKLGELAGFASAIILGMIALFIAAQAVHRILAPVPIIFHEAIAIAFLGLIVNAASGWLLHDDHHAHGHDQGHAHHHRDNNLRSAYIHVLADAATSVLAILGLLAAWIYGWVWMDPIMGIIGACVIASWSYTLMRDTGRILLDVIPDKKLAAAIRARLETGGDAVTDLHLWQAGPGHYVAIISLVADDPQSPAAYKKRLDDLTALSHVTIEVHPCRSAERKRG
jgi:cation diffusion facilitator family transporter